MSPAQQAIATLIDLAQQGEIDPWDVQVIEVIDRFLQEIGLMGESELPTQEADLPRSGQAFLWASMLVSLKADTLERLEQEEEEETDLEGFSDLESLDSNGDRRLPLHLERHIRRRASAPPPKRRRVTLQELIEQIQQIAVQLEENSSKTRIPRSRPYTRKEALRTITQLAHDENLTELATQLEQFLGQNFSQLAQEQNYVDLEQLLEWWTKFNLTDTNHTEITNSSAKTHDRVGIFWALLLLSSQSKVELMQEEFYQDLIIKPLI